MSWGSPSLPVFHLGDLSGDGPDPSELPDWEEAFAVALGRESDSVPNISDT